MAMRRGTTPPNSFVFDGESPADFEKIVVTYAQRGRVLINRDKSQLSIDATTVYLRLTQVETLLFTSGVPVEIQIRVLRQDGTADASPIYRVPVEAVLNDSVLGGES